MNFYNLFSFGVCERTTFVGEMSKSDKGLEKGKQVKWVQEWVVERVAKNVVVGYRIKASTENRTWVK